MKRNLFSDFIRLLSLALFLVFIPSVASAYFPKEQVPEMLRPWVDWALHGSEDQLCPFLNEDTGDRICGWAGRLDLSIEEKDGRFSQQWQTYTDGWVPLPGDAKRWPQEVKVDGQAASVVLSEESPSVYLKKGTHTLVGTFLWDTVPESFQVPQQTGLLKVSLRGQPLDFPNLDENGLLWLEKTSQAGGGEEHLELRVHRKIEDEIPLILTTLLKMEVSGKPREILLGKVLPEGFIPMSLDSALPARLEPDGRLKVQVRAGTWKIEVKARHQGPVDSIALQSGETPLAPEEVWVFEARNNLRLVSIEGVPSIDPQQTTLPDEWKNLPAYRLKPGETLKLVESRRGDSDPAPDQLSLYRELWLDFNGGGYSISDHISGTMNRGYRLEMNAPTQLGRVSVDGKDQFITSLSGDPRAGIEVRQGSLEVTADSRLSEKISHIPAVGWNQDFQKVSGLLHLPPGWRLFSVSGADEVSDTWVTRWTLLDIFVVLIAALTFSRLWGMRWGLLALATLVLTFTEHDAPQWIWLAVLAGAALLRVLSQGKLHTLLKFYQGVVLILLVIWCVPFMIQQIRVGTYPVLEHPYQVLEAQGGERAAPPPPQAAPSPPTANAPVKAKGMVEQEAVQQQEAAPMKRLAKEEGKAGISSLEGSYTTNKPSGMGVRDMKVQLNLSEQNPGTKVQTGPGLPRWDWNQFDLRWNGPVAKNQNLRLILLPPFFNLILAFLRVFLLACLVLCVMGFPGNIWPSFLKKSFVSVIPFFIIFSAFIAPARADYPSEELLKTLRERLLETPECYPQCAGISRMQLEVRANQLRARLEIGVEAVTAVPLPGSAKEWLPEQVLVDGQNFAGLYRSEDGKLWIQLTPGLHQVLLEGVLPERASVSIALPMKPHRLDTQITDWTLAGLNEDGSVEDILQLTRTQALNAESQGTPQAKLPPLVSLERHLLLGLNWELQTQVIRRSPVGTAIVLEVPLLEGESVTDPNIQVINGKVAVNLAPNATDFEWHSVLAEKDMIHLKASEDSAMTEVWKLDLNPVWHVSPQGIPPVHPQTPQEKWPITWQPWPGEELSLKISRPEGIAGQTLTIDQSLLAVTPGLRYTEADLSLNLRSSLGGQHVLTLPAGAELQSVSINGSLQPIRQEGQKVTLPLVPGNQQIELKWNQPGGVKVFFKSPMVDLGIPSVNSEIQLHMPDNRWILLAGGLRVGPAVLFWSLLVVLVLVSLGLGRVGLTPLKTYQWVLLGLGMTQIPVWASLIVAGWLLVLGWRKKHPLNGTLKFDFFQLLLVFWSLGALGVLFFSIQQGLLGLPDMQIAGNGSSHDLLRWFQDRSREKLSQPWVVSLPLFTYRLAMLAWALWIAMALLRWLRWGWQCLNETGLWRTLRVRKNKAPTAPP